MNFQPTRRSSPSSLSRLLGCLLVFGAGCLGLGFVLGALVGNPLLHPPPALPRPETREDPHATNTSAPIVPPPVPTLASTAAPLPPTETPQPHPAPAPTPRLAPRLVAGGTAQVANTGGVGLRIRQAPTATAAVLARVADGTRLRVRDGPRSDGTRAWWQVSGFDAQGTLGWAAADYLTPVP